LTRCCQKRFCQKKSANSFSTRFSFTSFQTFKLCCVISLFFVKATLGTYLKHWLDVFSTHVIKTLDVIDPLNFQVEVFNQEFNWAHVFYSIRPKAGDWLQPDICSKFFKPKSSIDGPIRPTVQ
jgi:hypothetical protein